MQSQELTCIREHESRILEHETESQATQLGVQIAQSVSLMRVLVLLCDVLHAFDGEAYSVFHVLTSPGVRPF